MTEACLNKNHEVLRNRRKFLKVSSRLRQEGFRIYTAGHAGRASGETR